VRGSVALARRLRVPPVAVALSIVAFGTSLPELVVSVRASLSGYPDLILGNAVGSNIANILLVGGVAAVVFPLSMRERSVRRTGNIMLLVSIAFVWLCFSGDLSLREGWAMLAGFGVVLALTAHETIQDYRAEDRDPTTTPLDWVLGLPSKLPTIAFFIVVGVVTLPIGADLLIESAVEIAARVGVSNTVVGLSVVAIGTSLPELTTSVVAAMQRRPAMVVGTIIGSNTFNILAIMGVSVIISPGSVPVSGRFLTLDLPVMVGTALVLVAHAWLGRPIRRVAGVLFVVAYVAYVGVLYLVV
jgi:cation:H+ antiporter